MCIRDRVSDVRGRTLVVIAGDCSFWNVEVGAWRLLLDGLPFWNRSSLPSTHDHIVFLSKVDQLEVSLLILPLTAIVRQQKKLIGRSLNITLIMIII